MKKVLQGLFSVKAFRNNYLAAAATTALFLLSQVVYAQPNSSLASSPKYDSTRVLQPINADGFYWTGVGKFGGGIVVPQDTFKLSIQSKGALAYKNLKLYEYTGSYWVEAGFKRYWYSPDGSVSLIPVGDSVLVSVTGAPNNTSPSSYFINPADLTASNDTVTFNPNLEFVLAGVRDTLTVGQEWIVRTLGGDSLQTITVYLSVGGAVDTLQGTIGSGIAVPPFSTDVAIILGHINVSSTVQVTVSSLFPETSLLFSGSDRKAKGDSTLFAVNEATGVLTAPAFKSNVVGGVALQMGNGSDIRSDERMYLTSASTMMFRTNGFGKRMSIYPSGNVGIGGPDTDVPSAILNLFDTTSKGFLPPVMRGVRMDAISSPATGLIVYNSDSLSLCLYNGSAWVKLGSGGSGTSGWGLTGNSGTDSTVNFLGTTNARPLLFRVNNSTVAKFGTQNNLSIGIASTASAFMSTAIGVNVIANAPSSFVIGANNTASGQYSFAGGLNNVASGQYSFSFGLVNKTKSENSMAVGRYSDTTDLLNDTIRLFSIGNGFTNGLNRRNIFTATATGIGINTTTPDSTLHVVGGIKQVNNYYTAAASNRMLVIDTLTGGYGHQAIPGGGSGATIEYLDIIGSGASNMSGRDTSWKDLFPTTFPNVQSFNSSNLFVTANPSLNNICYSDPTTTATRNNTAWQFGIDLWKNNLEDTIRMVVNAVGSSGSWEWTPQTTGVGEVTTSNIRLTGLMTQLDATPLNYKAKVIIMQYGESDAVNNNIQFLDTNIIKFYDTLVRHRACDTAIVMMVVYPITNQPINGDSLRLSLDSIYYRTRRMGQRNIMAIPHTYPGTASGHPSNDTTTLIAKVAYSNYIQGFANGPIEPDSSYWKRSSSPEYLYTPEKVVIGAASPISSSYITNFVVNGTSTLAYFGRSNSGSDGNQQGLAIAPTNASSTGVLLMHRSEKSGSVADRNGFGFRDTSIVVLDSNQNVLGLTVSNNAVGISKQLNVSANALYTGNLLMTTSTQPLRIFNTTTTGLQMIVSNNATTAGTYSSIRYRSGSVGTYDLADLRTIVNAAGDGGHFTIFTRKSAGLAETIRFTDSNKVGIGVTAVTGLLHLKAGTATAWTAPLKFESGTNLTTPENGAVEFNGTDYFVTSGGVRYTLQRVTTVPASASATGVAGSIAYDSSFIYVCVSTNTWVRAALATW